jgi:hypothetical protein
MHNDAHDHAIRLRDERGWSHSELVLLLCRFVTEQGLADELEEFLEEQDEAEADELAEGDEE